MPPASPPRGQPSQSGQRSSLPTVRDGQRWANPRARARWRTYQQKRPLPGHCHADRAPAGTRPEGGLRDVLPSESLTPTSHRLAVATAFASRAEMRPYERGRDQDQGGNYQEHPVNRGVHRRLRHGIHSRTDAVPSGSCPQTQARGVARSAQVGRSEAGSRSVLVVTAPAPNDASAQT